MTLDLTIYNPVNYTNNQLICPGDSFVVGNNVYTLSGTYIDSLFTNYGCDSTITYNVTEGPELVSTVDTTVCFGTSYVTPQGTTVTPSGGFATLDETISSLQVGSGWQFRGSHFLL